MRISDWSSDVCSSDLFNYPRSDTTSPRSIPSVPVGGELQSTSDGDDSSTKGKNVPEPKSDGNDNSDNGSHTLPADLGSGMWKAFSHSIGCCDRSEEHKSELQSIMRISYAVFCLQKKNI